MTKGRSLKGPVTTVPYLAVANVQDGHVTTDGIKSIEATAEEIEKYSLVRGDLVLTEGGDPDKLGRGAVWDGRVVPCIHQNHIFRVRMREALVPEFASALLGSERGKRYFLRMAKQTTGIASINMSQLRAFSVLEPPLDLQLRYVARLNAVSALRRRAEVSVAQLDALFASLQHRAFRGEL